MLRAGLAQLIDNQPDMMVCFEAESPATVLAQVAREKPDLVVTDLTMTGGSGFELLKSLRAKFPAVRVLVLSMHDETIYAERVIRAGADGYVMKALGGEQLLTAIRRILEGRLFLSETMWSQLVITMGAKRPRRSRSPIETLTDREFEVLELIGQGKSTREIATQLRISPKTVDVHRTRLRHKLELRDNAALIRYAMRWAEVMNV